MSLSQHQKDLISQLDSSYINGLSRKSVLNIHSNDDGSEGPNTVDPPVNCPDFICCLLPCIKNIPSMKLYRSLTPEDAEVLRNGKWVCYDASSIVRGDIIRLRRGDIVPGDCIVLSLGLNHVTEEEEEKISIEEGKEEGTTSTPTSSTSAKPDSNLMVDVSMITGDNQPIVSSLLSDGSAEDVQLFYGGNVTQGSAIAIVTAVGNNTKLANLIRTNQWPPKGNTAKGEGEGEEKTPFLPVVTMV